MAYPYRTTTVAALIAAAGLTAAVPAWAAADAAPDRGIASLRGSGRIVFPPSPGDDVRFTIDAHTRYRNTTGSPFPAVGDSWGTARLSHVFTSGPEPATIWYAIKVTCLMTGGPTAAVTGEIVDAAPQGRTEIGKRLGFSVADLGGQDRVGFTGLPREGDPELSECMAPAAYFELRGGDYQVRDAGHW